MVNYRAIWQYIKLVKAYMSATKSSWKLKLDKAANSYAVKEKHIRNVIVILALKNQLFDNMGKFEGQYFSNRRCEIVKKLFCATTSCILFR